MIAKIMRRMFALVSLFGLSQGVSADDLAEIKQAAEKLRACYQGIALVYGVSRCDSPPALLGAVFGKCNDGEEAL